jgi:hypothetical protein
MPKNTEKTRKAGVEFNANITSKFDLLAMEPELGFYYLNFYDHCQKAHIYWCCAGDAGGLMRFHQTGIASKKPPHLNLILPPQVNALALRDLVARLDTSLLLDPQKYFCQEDEDGDTWIGATDDVRQWLYQLEQDIDGLPKAQFVIDMRTLGEARMKEYLDCYDVEFPVDASESELRDLARLLGERLVAKDDIYCWRLPWALLDFQKTLQGVDREQQKREVATLARIFSGYRQVKLEDAIFHENVAVNM